MASPADHPEPAVAPDSQAPGKRRITEFQPEDAAAVAEMFNSSHEGWPGGFGDTPWTAEKVLQMQHDRQPLATLIAWDGPFAAGYCSLYEYPGEPGQAGYIALLNSAARFRGRGHGRDLLKAALQRCLELGYRRLDLHTWPGNMRAVPLYKKSGYFWVPDTSVHMENYLPLLLRIPALADFWAEADWYQSQIRDLSVQEDRFLDGTMYLYPYEFRHGDRFVKAVIDATVRGLTALETERWRIACRVDGRRLIIGRSQQVRWEVENRTGSSLTLTLLAEGQGGLQLHKEETLTVQNRYTSEAKLTVAASYQPPEVEKPAPHVESLIVLDGLPLHLETGVEVKPAIEVRLLPRRLRLLTDQRHTVTLQIQSYLDEQATATLCLAPSSGLALNDGEDHVTVFLPPESYAGITVRVRALTSGIHSLELRAAVITSDDTIAVAPVSIPLPAVHPGEIVAYETPAPTPIYAEREECQREVRVETATHRLVVNLRGGYCSLEDASTGAYLGGVRLAAGPPFSWEAQSLVRHQATMEQHGGALTVRLRGIVPHLPATLVEHELELTTDGLLRLVTVLTNTSTAPLEAQAAVGAWSGGNRETVALPTAQGLIVTSLPEFPDWDDPELHQPERFAEQWVAREGEDRVIGLLWSQADRVELGNWSLIELRQGKGSLGPGERRVLPAVYCYAGPGDWRTIRHLWRTLIAPDAPERAPVPRDVLRLAGSAAPNVVLFGEENRLQLSSMTNRTLHGDLHFKTPPNWTVEPTSTAIRNLRIDQIQEVRLIARHHDTRPAAAPFHAFLRTGRLEQRIFNGALLSLGHHNNDITISESEQEGQRAWTVDNGYLRFRLAPQFAGSIITLETLSDGINHLYSAFPEPREFGWMRPWFGGIYTAVYNPGSGYFPGAGRIYEEHLIVEPVMHSHKGHIWKGLAVSSVLQSRGLHGLELHTAYLTLPGSNLLALRVTMRNTTSATLPVNAAVISYLQPGGTTEDAELLLSPSGEQRLLRAQRTSSRSTDDWIGVRNPRRDQTIVLVRGAASANSHVEGIDAGTLGAHAGLNISFHLDPHAEQSALAYLVLARDETEAAAYRALAGADLL